MNYLLFRAPAYTDKGGKPAYDFFLIYPTSMRGQLVRGINVGKRFDFQFAHFQCINIGMYLKDVSSLSEQHWNLYRQACLMAAKCQEIARMALKHTDMRPNTTGFACNLRT